MSITAFIFARGGSKGLPQKNTRDFLGKPLIAWSIDHAKSVPRIDRVIVSTDSEEIAAVALAHGAEVPFLRPAELATDTSPEWFAWRHALQYLEDNENYSPEVMVSVPATSPLRHPADIDSCLDEYLKGDVDAVITVCDSHRNPWFNMVKPSTDGYISLVNTPENPIYRRQDAPVVFDMTTVAYVLRPQFVLESFGLFTGRIRAVTVPLSRSTDIDTFLDFEFSEYLMKTRQVSS
jgi:CMP-N-acetylneuraminic acid synthetase